MGDFARHLLLVAAFGIALAGSGRAQPVDDRKPAAVSDHVAWLGSVEFLITCQQPLTQLHFNRGVAWLHVFDSQEANRAFSRAALIEPECAMTWCGLALANLEHRVLARQSAEKAVKLQAFTSARERRWIAALVDYLDEGTDEADRRIYFTKSLDRIAAENPDDLEAKAFLVRQFLENREAGIPIPYTTAADALISDVLRVRPDHPIHHYRILLWEQDQPQRALASAKHVQRSMPAAPRVLTAAGRLFAKLSKDDEALHCFEASAKAAQRRMREQRLCPGDVDGYIENMEQLITQLAHVGRTREAVLLAKQLIELPTCAPTGEPMPAASQHRARPKPRQELANPTTTGQRLLIELLVRSQMWDELRTLAPSVYMESADPEIQVRRVHALGLGHFARQDTEALATQLQALRQLAKQLPPSHGGDPARRKLESRVQSYLAELESCDLIARGGQPTGTPRPRPNNGPTRTPAEDGLERNSPRPIDGADVSVTTSWEPFPAPAFVLPDRNGSTISLDSFRGKPVVLVFYLGAGCPHCITQLQSFAPLREDYEKAGITVIAISTDSVEGLQDTFRVAGAGDAIPFLLVSDQQLGVFREFGAYDHFENKPLHGTFLVDPFGRILWQNIRREPFMATRQLLAEAQRVLALSRFAEHRQESLGSRSE